MATNLGTLVVAPKASEPPQSLLKCATNIVIPDDDPNKTWEMGVYFWPESCQCAAAYPAACSAVLGEEPESPEKCGDECRLNGEVAADTFIVYQPYSCSTRGMMAADYAARASGLLQATAPKTVEHVFWTGNGSVVDGDCFQALTNIDPEDDGVMDTPISPCATLRAHIQYLATCGSGGRGMIHATPALVSDWYAADLLVMDRGKLMTAVGGHYVIPGAGYTGSGPGDVPTGDPNLVWSYCTSMVYYHRSGIWLTPDPAPRGTESAAQGLVRAYAEATDRLKNRVEYFAEETFAIWRDPCCHGAILTDFTCGSC